MRKYKNKVRNYASKSWVIGGLVWLIWLSGCQPDVVIPERRPIPVYTNKQGVHLLLDDGRHHWPESVWPAHLQAAQTAVGKSGFVTQLVRLDDLNVDKWQTFMDLCAELNLKPIIRLATTYDREKNWWTIPLADRNGRSYTNTARQIADFSAALTWPTAEHYLIVGNEPNHGDEWGGRPDPAAYGQFLIDVSTAVKNTDPQARILNAGLDPFTPHSGRQPLANGMWYLDSETFLDEMVAAHPDIFLYIDGWASHPYPLGPFIEPPWQQSYQIDWLNDATNPNHKDAPANIFNRGINGYEWELWKLATYGVTDLPVFITETGWRHTQEPYPAPEMVEVYLSLAMTGECNTAVCPQNIPDTGWTPWQDDERIIAVTPFAFNGSPGEWAHTNWLQLNEMGHIKNTLISWSGNE